MLACVLLDAFSRCASIGEKMLKTRKEKTVYHHKSKWPLYLAVSAGLALCVGTVSFFLYNFIDSKLNGGNSARALVALWNGGNNPDYASVYETSANMLLENPFNNTALTYHGYASFFLAVSQLDTTVAQNYLDEAINCMRLALISARKSLVPQLNYMLGKTYFYKNSITSYYYADLAIKYLKKARESGYVADDIAEYLGLSYASLGMTMESIASFSDALLLRESDLLLLSIAEQYSKAGNNVSASQYLYRVINFSSNDDIVLRGKILLGNIYVENEDYGAAQKEFEGALKLNENSADARYGLGVVFEKKGELARARAEWRRTLRISANHAGALQKISQYR